MDAESKSTEDEIAPTEQIPSVTNPNSVLLTFSWSFFGVGAYLLYWAISGWYGESKAEEGKLAFATLLGVLAFPLGLFVRRWAHRGFTKALGNTLTPGSPW
jgi:hypothetical protein